MTELKPHEQEIRKLLMDHAVEFDEFCEAYDLLDFCIHSPQRGRFYFDVKEKLQPIRLDNWPETGIPQEQLLILDDLAVRKVLKFTPNSGLLVRDNTRRSGHWLRDRQSTR